MKKLVVVILLVAAIVGLGLYFANKDSKPVTLNNLSTVPNETQLVNNMNKAGLEMLAAEGTVMHIHQHLDLVINGETITVPAAIGIATSFISPLHTHDTTGILHVESPVQKDFTLGQFFDEWGVDFNDNCLANNCVDDTHKLIVFVNGELITSFRSYVLKGHDEIYIWYGSKDENPTPIKSSTFPEGY